MNLELENKMLERFPWIRKENKESEKLTPYNLICTCGDGWFDLIWEMLIEIENLYKSKNLSLDDLSISDIGEKYGLMITDFFHGVPEIYDITEKYEILSESICEYCGSEGKLFERDGWFKTLCRDCARK